MSYISARIFPEFALRDTNINCLLKVRISPRTIAAKIGNFSNMRGCFENFQKEKWKSNFAHWHGKERQMSVVFDFILIFAA